MIVVAEQATVYRAPTGRRYLSARAAYRRAAVRRVYSHEDYRCDCEADVGYDCGTHTEEVERHVAKLIARLARFYAYLDRKSADSSSDAPKGDVDG